jgi:hypothetical protein
MRDIASIVIVAVRKSVAIIVHQLPQSVSRPERPQGRCDRELKPETSPTTKHCQNARMLNSSRNTVRRQPASKLYYLLQTKILNFRFSLTHPD